MSLFHTNPQYKRIILKFSGEALAGDNGFGIDHDIIDYIIEEIKPVLAKKVEIGIVIGGGNLFRGADLKHFDRITADKMGMLATLSNALAMHDRFSKKDIPVKMMSALPVAGVICAYDRDNANAYLLNNNVVIFAGGTGNPLVTTDTALSLRGIELGADLLLKATNVDGVYTANPNHDPKAELYKHLTFDEALTKKLQVMDLNSFSLCRDYNMKLRVYNMLKAGALLRVILGEDEGTLVEN